LEPSGITELNKLLPKPMSIIGTYVDYFSADNLTAMSVLDAQVEELLRQKGTKPVFQITMGVDSPLEGVDQVMADFIAKKLASIEKQGITIWFRWLWEMNGNWYPWGAQPEEMVAAWKIVYKAVHKRTKKTHMLWSPNTIFSPGGNISDPNGGWQPYFPGKDYVDLTGLSLYHFGGGDRNNVDPVKNEAFDVLDKFDKNYGSKIRKYMVLSETSASYTVDVETGVPAPGNATEYSLKTKWVQRVISAQKSLPWYRAAVFFEIIKDENAGGDSPVKRIDFRLLHDPKIRKKVLSLI